jgi:ketosteroid isomerase-like protein
MKRISSFAFDLILIIACASAVWARDDAKLRANVEALYEKADQAWKTKDLDGYMSLLTDDFQNIYLGRDREGSRNLLKDLFDGYDELRVTNNFLEITRSGDWIKVINDSKLEGKARNKEWSLISQNTFVELLVQAGNSLRFARSVQVDKFRLPNVVGQTYRDVQTGFSFTAPQNWGIFPTSTHPTIQGCVFVLAPDGTSGAMLGYVKAPGVNAQQAAEGDEALGKVLSKPGTYRLIRSGPIRVNGRDGFEIESEFFIASDRERHRRRVYLNADDLLYVLCFDAMPFKQWDKVKDGFLFILNSIR